jgi:hypothetical protein
VEMREREREKTIKREKIKNKIVYGIKFFLKKYYFNDIGKCKGNLLWDVLV